MASKLAWKKSEEAVDSPNYEWGSKEEEKE